MNLRYGKLFKIPRKIVKHFLNLIYPIVIKIWPLPKVKSIPETIIEIINFNRSIARFGDSEFLYIIDKINLPYQEYNKELSDKLISILSSEKTDILVGLPIGYYSLNNLNWETRLTWRSQIAWIYPRLKKYLLKDKIYANASISRLYIDYEDKSLSSEYFELIKRIWKNRDILIVEGEKSRLGVGNDLFLNAKSVQRILGPSHNAFKKFNDLFLEVLKQDKSKLVLIALGPTAKPLAFELACLGFQAIDIGNIDIEYEWYNLGVKEKVKIHGKYTSEAKGGRIVEDLIDEQYTSQVIANLI